jgi:hypothetical protein
MAETLEPLADPLLRELVDAEKARPDPPEGLAQRVLARLEPGLGADRADGAPAAALDGTWAGRLLGRGWTRAALIFATGVVVGAGAHAAWRRISAAPDEPRPRSVAPSPGAGGGDRGLSELRAPAGAPSASPPTLDAGSRSEPPAPRPPLPAAREAERSSGSAGARLRAAPPANAPERESPPPASPTPPSFERPDQRDAQLAAERNLIEIARSALARGETEGALEALRRHARRHPDGDLREEREGLYIQALIRRGDYGEARARAADFGRLYPRSLFRPTVEQALRSIP